MYTPCAQCGNIIESLDEHDCPSNPNQVIFQSIGYGTVHVSCRVASVSWQPTPDGFAELTFVMKGGSEIIHKVARRTAIGVCRKLMGDPR